ncbi:Sorting nexin-17 [Desmophyllum pertusum]|uniref:Sorting nexin-17 n=1 Tax=Desmophyllum pertusum TaxID=174260 RepID=A0A9X0CKJ2_9CNID|nr:Sorting nexin-17 [Desmophyllum pertusum]
MHFSVPDTVELKDKNGSNYLAYNVHINGSYHCGIRFSDLYQFSEQLRKEFGPRIAAKFPPRKLLSLTLVQVEERRSQLEKYLQAVCQDPGIASSSLFVGFFLNAQKVKCRILKASPENVQLDIYLMNGQKVALTIQSTDRTDDVLEALMAEINLNEDLVYYFGLFMIKRADDGEATIVRKFQDFEAPFLTIKQDTGTCRVAVRKTLWDPTIEDKIVQDRIGMNLLYVQAVSDLEKGWTVGSKEAHAKLMQLKQKGNKMEFLQLARSLRFYGYMQFKPCTTNYPEVDTRVITAIGDRELNFRLQTPDHKIQEGSFKVTRMRCWRITSTSEVNENGEKEEHLELAFEYLIRRDKMQWVTIYSDQAILMSLCLQTIVDEILRIKQGKPVKRPKDRAKMKKETTPDFERANSVTSDASTEGDVEQESKDLNSSTSPSTSPAATKKQNSSGVKTSRQLSNKGQAPKQIPSPTSNAAMTTNKVFEGIGDDDL